MGNAFRKGDTLIYDYLHRRSRRSEGLTTYPTNVLNAHEEFTRRILESSAAKVEIVYGKAVQKRILETMKTTVIPLWGHFQGVFLFLLHEVNFQNHDERYMFRKVLLFAAHPQHMFYQRRGFDHIQDRILEAAVLMADPSLNFNPNYFKHRLWESRVSLAHMNKRFLDRALMEMLGSLQEPCHDHRHPGLGQTTLEMNGKDDSWNLFWDRKPSSNEATRSLLPAAVAAIQSEPDETWKYPSDIPSSVSAWLQGQAEALFDGQFISCADDFVQATESYYSSINHLGGQLREDQYAILPSLKRILEHLILAQKEHLSSLKKIWI